jgi:hypothetical protein
MGNGKRQENESIAPSLQLGTAGRGLWGELLQRKAVVAAAIFLILLAAYHANVDFLYGNDAKPSVYLAATLLENGRLSFTPSQFPFMFVWGRLTEKNWVTDSNFGYWDQGVAGQPYTYRQLLESGGLKLFMPRYYIVPSIRTTAAGEKMYVDTFGPGAAMTALPVYALMHLVAGGDLLSQPALLWYGAKITASLLVAGSAVFIFLTACAFTTSARAALIALVYGLGTGVWSTSSQTLWQHGPNEFFLAMGTYFLIRAEMNWKHAAWCGLAYSAAVACRPTSVIVAVAAGIYLLVRLVTARRTALVPYVLAALPIAAALAAYNTYYLGGPLKFGQAEVGHMVAAGKTGGNKDLWQTPLWLGATGLMVSPSRGLLVFSPFMIFAMGGLVALWTQRRYAPLWPVTIAMLVLLGVAFKWFDWWGGWCYGPRPIVDTMPFFALLLIPVIDWIWRRKVVLVLFLILAAWAVAVQVLGVTAYDMFGWNSRLVGYNVYVPGVNTPVFVKTEQEATSMLRGNSIAAVEEVRLNVDDAKYRYRLWSLSDNQIGYYVENFHEARCERATMRDAWLKEPSR